MTHSSHPDQDLQPRTRTLRQAIVEYLNANPQVTAREISSAVGLPEKAVCAHLLHLQKSLRAQNLRLLIIPAKCLDCGFAFRKRERLNRPSKCPVCRSTHLNEPRYSLS